MNIRKEEQYVKKRRPSMMTDLNQVYFAKVLGREVQWQTVSADVD
jgi:hypothetical protein